MAMSIRSSMSSPCSFKHLQASVLRPSCLSNNHLDRCRFLGNRSFLQPLIIKVESDKKMAVVVNGVEPGTPLPPDPSDTDWKLRLVGMLFSVAIPFWKNKWGPLQKIKEEALETVEALAWFAAVWLQSFIEAFISKAISEVEGCARSKARKEEARKQELEVEEVEKEVDSIIEQANKNIEEENDTEDQTAKIKDATEIKTAENKETNAVKKE